MSDRRWSIGELARASGVTVRTLHYYDQIGLVSPGERTGAGHRRYVEADIRRLYRVRALSGLGLSLEEVATVLRSAAEGVDSLRDLLSAQLADLEMQAGRIEKSARRVRGLLGRLDGSVMPEPEQFLSTLEPMSVDISRYLSDTQLTALTDRASQLGDKRIEALKAEWVEVFSELRQHLLAGTPAEDPAVRPLVARWQTITDTFHTGDRQLETAVSGLWEDNRAQLGEQLDQRIGWSDPGGTAAVVDYLHSARSAYSKENS